MLESSLHFPIMYSLSFISTYPSIHFPFFHLHSILGASSIHTALPYISSILSLSSIVIPIFDLDFHFPFPLHFIHIKLTYIPFMFPSYHSLSPFHLWFWLSLYFYLSISSFHILSPLSMYLYPLPYLILTFTFLSSIHMCFSYPFRINYPTYFHNSSVYLILTSLSHSSCHVHVHSFIFHPYIFLHTSTMLPYIRSWHAIPILHSIVLVMFISSIFHPYTYILPSFFHMPLILVILSISSTSYHTFPSYPSYHYPFSSISFI